MDGRVWADEDASAERGPSRYSGRSPGSSRRVRFSPKFLQCKPQLILLPSTNVIYGDQFSFPVYTPDADVLAARAAAFAASAPLVSHYDASAENRSKAAGAYSFSQDEDTRREQMAALQRERDETETLRRKKAEGGGVVGEREREKEERKRKVEAKRRELEMKRKRAAGGGVEEEGGSASKVAKI